MRRLAALLAILSLLPLPAHAQTVDEQRARYERYWAEERAFVRGRFDEAGFTSIAEPGAEGRAVRRVLLRDPYGMFAMPGVEVERLSDGRAMVRLQYRAWSPDPFTRAWSSDPVEVDRSAWDELASLEQALFTRPPFQPMSPEALSAPRPPPPPTCHAWIAWFEADRERTASWSGCGGINHPGYRYAARVAELAVGSKPGCVFTRGDPFQSFSRCFSLTSELEDPALQSEFAALRKDYDGASGSERLAEARRALQGPGLAVGSPAWHNARAAVAAVKEVHDFRKDRLNQLRKLLTEARNASRTDKAKMLYTIENWSQALQSQEPNYAQLLEQLAWPDGEPASRQ